MKSDMVYVQHILECIQSILSFTESGRADFVSSKLVQDAVIRDLEVIGEAAKHIADELRGQYGSVPWREMAGMRDVLIHNYFGVDLDAVWNVVDKELPPLKTMIEQIISAESRG